MARTDNADWQVVNRGQLGEVGYPVCGIKYRPLMWSLVHTSVAIPSLVIWTISLSRVELNPASQNWPRDRRGCWRAGKISHFWAARGSWGQRSRNGCAATMI